LLLVTLTLSACASHHHPSARPAPPKERTIMKMQLHVTGNGRPLVIVGGGLTGILSFVPHAERLTSTRQLARAQPLAVQLGLDQAPLPDDYSIDMESRALEAAIDALGWTQPIDLVGWSTGGVIALDFALDHPERVRSLILIEPDAPWVLPDRGAADPDVRAAKERASRWARGVSEADLAAFLDEMLGPGQSARDNPRWDVWNQHRGALRAVAAIYEHRDDVARLGRFSRPVLLIKGEGTERYNAIISDALSRALPTARVVELPGGHLAPVVAMDRFLEEMEAFQAAAEPNR
jgi:pimeloyl-ACP methyl ester carboxylesterase